MTSILLKTIKEHYKILLLAIILGFCYPYLKLKLEKLKNKQFADFTLPVEPIDDIRKGSIPVFTTSELKEYSGEDGSKGLYLAILGSVYDVGRGRKHYGPGGSYNYFAAKDASRSFINSDGVEEDQLDDVLQLELSEILSLKKWKEFYDKDYIFKGYLVGRFYNEKGHKTDYMRQYEDRVEEALEQKQRDEDLKQQFPPCNIEWKDETGTRVWCTAKSGGVERGWIGVPRKYYEPGTSGFRCACVHEELLNAKSLKQYENCEANAISCTYTVDSD